MEITDEMSLKELSHRKLKVIHSTTVLHMTVVYICVTFHSSLYISYIMKL